MNSAPPLLQALAPLLQAAGAIALDAFGRVHAERKADGTAVTEVDRRAEALLVEGLHRLAPRDEIIGEEGGYIAGGPLTWYVDPLDGTSAYLEGLAHWGPTVCCVEGGKLRAGLFWAPLIGQSWGAVRGEGAWRGDERLPPAWREGLGPDAAIALPSRFHRRDRLNWAGKSRALGSTAAHLALVASGGLHAALVPDWKWWDIGAGLLMIAEVGGGVVDLHGRAYSPFDTTRPFWAGDPAALERLTATPFPGGFSPPHGEFAR